MYNFGHDLYINLQQCDYLHCSTIWSVYIYVINRKYETAVNSYTQCGVVALLLQPCIKNDIPQLFFHVVYAITCNKCSFQFMKPKKQHKYIKWYDEKIESFCTLIELIKISKSRSNICHQKMTLKFLLRFIGIHIQTRSPIKAFTIETMHDQHQMSIYIGRYGRIISNYLPRSPIFSEYTRL